MSSAFKRDDWTYTYMCNPWLCTVYSKWRGAAWLVARILIGPRNVFSTCCKPHSAMLLERETQRENEWVRESEGEVDGSVFFFCVCATFRLWLRLYGYGCTAPSPGTFGTFKCLRIWNVIWMSHLSPVCFTLFWLPCDIPPPPLPLPTLLPLCGTPRQHVGSWLPPRPLPCMSAC